MAVHALRVGGGDVRRRAGAVRERARERFDAGGGVEGDVCVG